jgi:hypothetical protein
MVCVWIAPNILPSGMVNDAMRIFAVKALITCPLIGAKQADFVGDGFADERCESIGTDIRDNTSDNVTLAADGADDWSFAGTNATSSTALAALILMPVFSQAADESFIDFNDAAKLLYISMRAVRTLCHMSQAVLYDPKPI